MPPWSPRETVVVLGAGATRGAEFVSEEQARCLPPLNSDFFTQLQRVTAAKHRSAIQGVLEDVLDLYGPNFSLTLEDYFSQLESMHSTLNLARTKNKRYSLERIRAMRDRLLQALSAVLEESADVTKQNSTGRQHPCSYHRTLSQALRARDTIISFNYDCVMDDALRRFADGKWSAQYGYGFPGSHTVTGHEHWDAKSPPGFNKSINLLKLHGSLNWFPIGSIGTDIRLRQKPYKQKGAKEYEIIPPEQAKEIEGHPVFETIWGNAELAIRRARTLALVGFSFTPTDLHVESLFRLALAGNTKIERLIVVNPSKQHRNRIRQVFSAKLREGIQVVQFETFKSFHPHAEHFLNPSH